MTDTPRHPYLGLPDRQFWRNEPGIADPAAFDPVSDVPFQISRADRVVTAGSCFAQHLGRHLAQAGFCHFLTEPAHPLFDDALAHRFGYGLFSARYGNPLGWLPDLRPRVPIASARRGNAPTTGRIAYA